MPQFLLPHSDGFENRTGDPLDKLVLILVLLVVLRVLGQVGC